MKLLVSAVVVSVALYASVRAIAGPQAGISQSCVLNQRNLVSPGQPVTSSLYGNSIDSDGQRLIVGAPTDDGVVQDSGAAYIYVRDESSWVLEAKLKPDQPSSFSSFGFDVAILGDIAIVGSPQDNQGGSLAGAAYVFRRTGGAWLQEARLMASQPTPGQRFGTSVAATAGRAYIGTPTSTGGSVTVFRHEASSPARETWVEESVIMAPEHFADRPFFGRVFAVNEDRLVVGHPDSSSNSDAGYAHIYLRSGQSWSHETSIASVSSSSDDLFGYAVAFDGDRLLVGAPAGNCPLDTGGLVFGFRRIPASGIPGEWIQETIVSVPNISGHAYFGSSIVVKGNLLAVGAIFDEYDFGPANGSVIAFTRSKEANQVGVPEEWRAVAKITNPDTFNSTGFGNAIVVHDDRVLVGFSPDNELFEYSNSGGPSIVRHPIADEETAGQHSATFYVQAEGTGTLSYLWRNGPFLVSDGPSPGGGMVSGAGTAQLRIEQPGFADQGVYSCQVFDSCGEATSNFAVLTIVPPEECTGDANGDGTVNFMDITSTLENWLSTCH